MGNQTKVAAAAAAAAAGGGSRSAGTRGRETHSCLVMCDRADTDWVSKIMMFGFAITTEVDGNLK